MSEQSDGGTKQKLNDAEQDNANKSNSDVGAEAEPCPLEKGPDWVELAIVDKGGETVAGAEFGLQLPDGDRCMIKVADTGVARRDEIAEGTDDLIVGRVFTDDDFWVLVSVE